MARAIALTDNGRDTATPNPNVGCVIVKDGIIVGEGWHERAGEAHAEVRALEKAGASAKGSTAYVTLEPCAHQGRTGPCTDVLMKAGVARVVAALEDPFPQVNGRGIAKLRDAGIQVDTGLLADDAREAHRGFLSRVTRGRPWLRIKAAVSLDGRIALANGASRWITSEESRRDVHLLRARSCAMLTGIGTVLADDPELTVRHVEAKRQPKRVVIDSRLDMPLDAKILRGEPPIILTVSDDAAKRKALEAKGAEVVRVPNDGAKTDLAAIARLLGERGFNEVTVETGSKLMGSLLRAGVVDELVIYYAPVLLGDKGQPLAVLPELTRLEDAPRWRIVDSRAVGPDLRVTARLAT
jgi:diaminohydroxyphosphoribosylaminopyrimidine deaminase/5-amino-6-(5-phosphoribosylamino)uracil reductase